jgi:hypothetical protein
MAIDTVKNRGSALLDNCGILYPADGTIDTGDRYWLLGQYAGIPGSGPVATPVRGPLLFPAASVYQRGIVAGGNE